MATRRPAPDLSEIGSTGLNRQNGWIYEEPLEELRSYKWRRVIKEMTSNDPVVGGMLFAIEMLARRVAWNTVPDNDTPDARQAAEFVEECRQDMSVTWQDLVAEILTFLPWGWSFFENVYKVRDGQGSDPNEGVKSRFNDGKIGWRKWAIRSQDTLFRWIFDDNGGVVALEQQPPPDYKLRTIPMTKGLLFRATSRKNNPEGRSVLRNAYVPWYYKTNIQRIEAIGVERDLAGLPVALVPPELLSSSATTQETAVLDVIKKIIVNIRRDEQEGIVFPMAYNKDGKLSYELKLLSSGGNRQFDTNKIIERYDQRIAISLLADFLLLGTNRVGSFALSNDKTDLFATALTGWLDAICDVVNRYAIPRLLALNGMNLEEPPRLVHSEIKNVDLNALGNYIAKLTASGASIFPNPDLERYLLEVADLPVPVSVEPSASAAGQADPPADQADPPEGADPAAKPVAKKPTGTKKVPQAKPKQVNLKGSPAPSKEAPSE